MTFIPVHFWDQVLKVSHPFLQGFGIRVFQNTSKLMCGNSEQVEFMPTIGDATETHAAVSQFLMSLLVLVRQVAMSRKEIT